MTLRAPYTPITTELYGRMPEGPPYYQLIEGNLIMSPSPSFHHQKIVGRLFQYVATYLDTHPLGEVIFAPSDVFLNEINVFQPDLYFVSAARRSVIVVAGVEGAPDLVVEILSPSNSERDRNEKRRVYAQCGVQQMWIVDPELRQIEVHPLAQGLEVSPEIIREPHLFSPSIFPGLQIDPTRLFQSLS